ncbi:hypothetical protein caldi_14190 [Caldinitratiruptor microaerophilus]|uniref:Flagellar motor switch protein FliG n=1 Tax=Caldinitratiruptor microaerophilus TaxID=671077 RepID=A0AA35CJA4_9FIRM|nr:hypothetical protein caldi_14190 [Caldinitratiruptor microaerophilus]
MRQGKSASPTGLEKAAVFLIAIGPELAARVFRPMNQDEVELLSLEIARQRQVLPERRDRVLHEFYQLAVAQEYISTGGLEYARGLLEKALGPAKAAEIMEHLVASLQVRPFEFARKADPSQLLSLSPRGTSADDRPCPGLP